MKKTCFGIAVVMSTALSCKKTATEPLQLQTDRTSLSVTGLKESIDSFQVQTNGSWTLTVQNAGSAFWLQVSQLSGQGNTTVYVHNLEDNLTGAQKQASLELALTDASAVPSIILTVNQKDFSHRTLISKLIGGANRDIVTATALCSDGNVVIAGFTNSHDGDVVPGTKGNYDYWVLKVDTSANLLWKRTYGGTRDDYATCIQALPNGGYLVGGHTESDDFDITNNRGFTDAWLVRLDEQGNKIWQKTYGGNSYDYINAMTVQTDGSCLLAGYTMSGNDDIANNRGSFDGWLLKVDINGSKLWSKTFGGSSADFFYGVIATAGGFIAVGGSASTEGDLANNKGNYDVWALEVDATGNKLWSKNYGGLMHEMAANVVALPDGGFLLAATTTSENGDVQQHIGETDGWLLKIDATGNLVWSKIMGGLKDESEVALISRKNGGFLLSMTTSSSDGNMGPNKGREDFWLATLNNDGAVIWKKTLGGTYEEYQPVLLLLPNNHYLLCGSSASEDGDIGPSHGDIDAWFHHFKEE